MQQHTNYLGIDWGERKLGIALAHAETRVAVALAIVPSDASWIDRIKELVAQESIGTILVGVPSREQGAGTKHPARVFGDRLNQMLGTKVVFVDEMFTSKLAQDMLILRGEKHVGSTDDAEAARILLQDWLDRSTSE